MSAQGAANVRAINCTSCGGTLDALAGHRAKSMICPYCGAVMDRHDGYRLLAQYRDMPRPEGPLAVGMTGEIRGVPHTVVGIVGVETLIEGELYGWTNYQIYAPTHGYSWLTWNDGHLTHTRKTRDLPNAHFGAFFPKREFSVAGRVFKMFEQYAARITYIEGELTWVPKLGETTTVIESIAPPHGYGVALGETETEYELSTYLDREAVLASFGVGERLPRPVGVHAIQPFRPGRLHPAIAGAAKYFAPLALVLGLGVFLFGDGRTVTKSQIPDPSAGGSVSFPINDTARLTELKLFSPVSNSWAWYEMSLTHIDTDETVAEFGGGVEYYYGRDSDGKWTEGSRTARLRFHAPYSGAYRLDVEGVEKGSDPRPLSIEVREGVMLSRYLFGLAILTAFLALSLWARKRAFEAKRWGGGEDDDD